MIFPMTLLTFLSQHVVRNERVQYNMNRCAARGGHRTLPVSRVAHDVRAAPSGAQRAVAFARRPALFAAVPRLRQRLVRFDRLLCPLF